MCTRLGFAFLATAARASLSLLVLFAGPSLAQTPFDVNQRLSPEQLAEDVDFYLKTLDEVHINPYSRISAKGLRARAEEVKARVRRQGQMTQKEFWLHFTPLVSAIGDSHTFVVDPRFFVRAESDTTKYFPVRTVPVGGEIVVKESFADEKIERGAVITAINGIGSREVIRRISGHRFGNERERVENAVLWLWVGAAEILGRPDEFAVSLSDGRTVRMKGMLLPEYIRRENAARAAGPPAAANNPPLELRLLGDGVAYLNSTTFSYDLEKYKEILKDVFTKIRAAGARALIVDVRANGGGNSALAEALIDMFNDRPYRQYSLKWRRSEQFVAEMRRKNLPVADSYLALRPGEVLDGKPREIKPGDNPLRFRGRVHVLSGKETFSSGQMFLALVKDNKLAEVVGEETNAPACNFGEIIFFNLPHSRLRVSVSTKSFIPPAGCKGARGVVPDVPVERRVADYVSGRDAILERALSLLKQAKDR